MSPTKVCVRSAEMEFCSPSIGLCLKDKVLFPILLVGVSLNVLTTSMLSSDIMLQI